MRRNIGDSKYHKLGLGHHNDNCIVTSLSNDIIRNKILIFFTYVMKSIHLILVEFFLDSKNLNVMF